MITLHKSLVETLFIEYRDEIDKWNEKAFDKLKRLKKENTLGHKENPFLKGIIREFENINFISCSLDEISDLTLRIGETPESKKRKFSGKSKESYLKDEILHCLDYSSFRTNFLPKYFLKLGTKTCVYCNSQLTTVIEKKKQKGQKIECKALFQVDHYHPQDKYPYLSIALFNLYPVCASCNLTKSDQIFDFKLYGEKLKTNIFRFELDKGSKARFLLSRNFEDLEINFKKLDSPNYQDIFNIKELYSTQKDVAEEIVLKALAYNPVYREYLKKLFKENTINDSLINRIILGNYSNEEEIYKRPMAKFMQDIGKEVGLILNSTKEVKF